MKLRTDKQNRLYGRDLLKPNTIYDAETDGSRIVLVEMVRDEVPQAKLVRRGGRTFLQSDREHTNEDVAAVTAQFP